MSTTTNTPTRQKDLLERDCALCERTLYEEKYEIYCEHCGYIIGFESEPTQKDEWEAFWKHRALNYVGRVGSTRKKCVGGFSGVWFKTDDVYVDG